VKCYFDLFSTNIYSPVFFSMTHSNTTIMPHFNVCPIKNGGRKGSVVLKRAYCWDISYSKQKVSELIVTTVTEMG